MYTLQNSSNERVHYNLGLLAMDEDDNVAGEKWLRNAVGLKEDFDSALYTLSQLLVNESRPLEAISFLKQLIKFHPYHTKGLELLGTIYINIKELDPAENVRVYIYSESIKTISSCFFFCVAVLFKDPVVELAERLESSQSLRSVGGTW